LAIVLLSKSKQNRQENFEKIERKKIYLKKNEFNSIFTQS
jgi:hypothetical protein